MANSRSPEPPTEAAAPKETAGIECRRPSCGAGMQYDAERSCMACSFCGATRPVGEAGEGQTIAQYDLESGLAASAERGYGLSVRRVACQQCGAVVSYGENEPARNCDFCGSAQVVEQSSSQKPIRPEA